MMSYRERQDLDRHITGNWGEDSVPPDAKPRRRRHDIGVGGHWNFPQRGIGCSAERRTGRGRPWTLDGKPAPYCEVTR